MNTSESANSSSKSASLPPANAASIDHNSSKRIRFTDSDDDSPLTYSVPTGNQFQELSKEIGDPTASPQAMNQSNQYKTSIPTINIAKTAKILNNFGAFISEIKQVAQSDFSTKVKSDYISIFFGSIYDYRLFLL